MNLFFNSAASDPASALARSQTNNQPALKPTFVLGDNPEINIYVTSGDGGFDPASGDASVTPSLGIGTPGAGPSGGTFWLGVSTATSGALTTAKRYQIETYVAGDDFANLGAAENATGVVFTSSGTTPTDWNNGSTLIEITTDVSYAASAATLEAALEATAAVVGVTVTKASAAPNFVVEWDSVGAVALLVGGPTSLTPASAVVTSELQAGSASAVERQIVRLTRQPYALQTVWSTIADGWSARLDCNTRGLLDFLEGEVSAGSTLELQLVDASQNVRTVGQVDCIIRNEAIDEASTIPTPFPSYMTATQVNQNFLQNRFQVTALDGGGTALDGIPTGTTALPTVPTDALVAIELGGDIFFYELVAGTDAESLPDVVRPDDYATTTNERVWLLRAVPSALPLHASTHEDGGADEISVTGLSGLLADGQTALAHASTHASAGSDPLTLAQSQVTSLTSDLSAKLAIAGGTMTGQLNFSGTTHAGIKLLSLTTTQRNALTPANGMLIYNTTTATVQKYEAGAWVDSGTPAAHASTHASAGSDPLTLAQSQVTSLTTDLAAKLSIAGGTMTGQLNFSGTTHAGLKLLSLTTAERDALTPANGMLIYNSTTATVQKYEAGAWGSISSALKCYAENEPASYVAPVASGDGSVAIGGNSAIASGAQSFCFGDNAIGDFSVALHGNAHGDASYSLFGTAWADASYAFGRGSAPRNAGQFAFGSGAFTGTGDLQQHSFMILSSQTTNATQTEALCNVLHTGGTSRLSLINESSLAFSIQVIARRTDTSENDAWEFKGFIHRDANAASTALDALQANHIGATGWAVDVDADTTNGSLRVRVTGAAASDILWAATIHTTEVSE